MLETSRTVKNRPKSNDTPVDDCKWKPATIPQTIGH